MIQFTKLVLISKYPYLVIKFYSKIVVPSLQTINEEIILGMKRERNSLTCGYVTIFGGECLVIE